MAKASLKPLLSDTPILEAERLDQLDFSNTAQVLAEAAVATADPLTIGVFGEWGSGKTSMMRLIKQFAENDKKTATAVWFNAWQYEKEEHLIIPLLATISNALTSTAGEAAKDVSDAIRSLLYAFTVKGKIGLPHIAEAELNFSPADAIKRYEELNEDFVFSDMLYFDAFEKLANLAKKKSSHQIVVLVDDLDRCFPDKAVELLEGIKLVLHQPGFSFVLGVNEAIIQAFIQTKYKKDYNLAIRDIDQYLDKIVQVKVNVPARDPGEMDRYITSLLEDVEVFKEGDDAKNEGVRKAIVPVIAESCNRNPRSVVRLLNRVMVTSRISKLEENEFDPIALLINEAMDEEKYKDMIRVLDYPLKKAEDKPIGQFLSDKLKEYNVANPGWFEEFQEAAQSVGSQFLDDCVTCLKDNPHICNVFKLPSGQKWLTNPTWRKAQAAQSEKTVGEKPSKTISSDVGENVKMIISNIENNLVKIDGGSFIMGGDKDEAEQPKHKVTVSNFEMGRTLVTQEQYQAVMRVENPAYFIGKNHPVEQVSWDDARRFCEELSRLTGDSYRLPSEAEWEFTCRSGTNSEYYSGFGIDDLARAGWYLENSKGTSRPVGEKVPNGFGLFDMHGNVWEWCEDDWHSSYELPDQKAPDDGSAWIDKQRDVRRVLRGGSWVNDSLKCRSASRDYDYTSNRNFGIGFRLVREAVDKP
jgi:formylglycine-generating enzyme required for sulfatase activity